MKVIPDLIGDLNKTERTKPIRSEATKRGNVDFAYACTTAKKEIYKYKLR